MQQKLETATAELTKLQPVKDRLKKESDQLEKERDVVCERSMKYENILNETLRKRCEDARERFWKKYKEFQKVFQEYISYLGGEFYLSGRPKPLQSIKTDSEGRFSFKLVSGKYALAAMGSRKVGDSTEKYYWFVWVTVRKDPTQKVMLSNDNLFETHPTACVVKIPDQFY